MEKQGFSEALLGALNGLMPPFCYDPRSMVQISFWFSKNSTDGRSVGPIAASAFKSSLLAAICTLTLGLGYDGAAAAQSGAEKSDKTSDKVSDKASPASNTEAVTVPPANSSIEQTNTAKAASEQAPEQPAAKVLLKPGQALTIDTGFEDIVCTNDLELARKQREAFPDNAEASFIYAVALSRTFKVEQALKEVRRARGLAEKEGGPAYFNKMISTYENMLTYCPTDNQVRYHLAWAYYMKAYLLARYDKQDKTHPSYKEWIKTLKEEPAEKQAQDQAATTLESAAKVKRTIEMASPRAVPQIQNYYKLALEKLDQILASNPTDVWARIYRAHLAYEAGGKLDESIAEWLRVKDANPTNPAPYFFLGEGFLKQGNLKESLKNVSQAVALRSDKAETASKAEVAGTAEVAGKTEASDKTEFLGKTETNAKAETTGKAEATEAQNKAKDGGQ